MDEIICTPRLCLTLATGAPQGSQEFEWLHELRSDKQASWWSIAGQSTSPADTERYAKYIFPGSKAHEEGTVPTEHGISNNTVEPRTERWKIVYMVHKLLEEDEGHLIEVDEDEQRKQTGTKGHEGNVPTRFIGCITLAPLTSSHLVFPTHLDAPDMANSPTLTLELGYAYLPASWSKGYAPEALTALFTTLGKATGRSFFAPYKHVWIRAIVNAENPASVRVMEKCGIRERGNYIWRGEKVWLAGKWRIEGRLRIFGKWIAGGDGLMEGGEEEENE